MSVQKEVKEIKIILGTIDFIAGNTIESTVWRDAPNFFPKICPVSNFAVTYFAVNILLYITLLFINCQEK